jgi:hypothetical protein
MHNPGLLKIFSIALAEGGREMKIYSLKYRRALPSKHPPSRVQGILETGERSKGPSRAHRRPGQKYPSDMEENRFPP